MANTSSFGGVTTSRVAADPARRPRGRPRERGVRCNRPAGYRKHQGGCPDSGAEHPGGSHKSYSYQAFRWPGVVLHHGCGATAITQAIYDMDKVLHGDAAARVGKVPLPPNPEIFPPATTISTRDMIRLPTRTGSTERAPADITSSTSPTGGTASCSPRSRGSQAWIWGHTFTPDPTGRYAVGEVEYQYAPLRIFDLKPGLDGTVKTISRPIGAWTANWVNYSHNHEVRWPYVFVAGVRGRDPGLQHDGSHQPVHGWLLRHLRRAERQRGLSAEQKSAAIHDGT